MPDDNCPKCSNRQCPREATDGYKRCENCRASARKRLRVRCAHKALMGLCYRPSCRSPVAPGRSMCGPCLKKKAIETGGFHLARKKAGRCIEYSCTLPNDGEHNRCDAHHRAYRAYQKKYTAQKKATALPVCRAVQNFDEVL